MSNLLKHLTWKAIPLAGVVAGTVFLLVNMILTPLLLGVHATPLLRYTAALVLGPSALTNSGVLTFIVGLVVHYAISILIAGMIAVVIHRWGLVVGLVGGGLLGFAFYAFNLYTLTRLFPWYFAINNSVLLIAHIAFGVVAGGVYESRDHYDVDDLKPAPVEENHG